jgi:hypothetical protein
MDARRVLSAKDRQFRYKIGGGQWARGALLNSGANASR